MMVAAAFALVSCVEAPPDAGQGHKFSPEARAQCEAAGGRVGRGGLFPDDVCFTTMADGGKACSRKTDCEGMCLADTLGEDTGATCAKESPMFGCFDFYDEQGERIGICVD
jgi:hypothetical protein